MGAPLGNKNAAGYRGGAKKGMKRYVPKMFRKKNEGIMNRASASTRKAFNKVQAAKRRKANAAYAKIHK